ncbi:MAG: DeoR/GlpR transcriptional regulator [Clostridia bacterium]|nr:DeoR/GlpR transcriptional regulator [Clostridia bacterium]
MYQNERLEKILKILEENGYTTVKYLTDELHYSNATINRDLALLEAKKLVKRSYGGVELEEKKSIPLVFRYHKMKSSKMKMAKAAAELIEDGDVVFIDATTTTQYMGHFLADKKDITVITNNMALATYLGDIGKSVICLGGEIVEAPYMLSGIQAVENARKLHADKMFFSTGGVTDTGKISVSSMYFQLLIAMAENSDKAYFLVDKGKLREASDMFLFSLDEVTAVISDFDLKSALKKDFPETDFIIAKK